MHLFTPYPVLYFVYEFLIIALQHNRSLVARSLVLILIIFVSGNASLQRRYETQCMDGNNRIACL